MSIQLWNTSLGSATRPSGMSGFDSHTYDQGDLKPRRKRLRLLFCDRYCVNKLLFSAANNCCGLPTSDGIVRSKAINWAKLPASLTDAAALAEHARGATSRP